MLNTKINIARITLYTKIPTHVQLTVDVEEAVIYFIHHSKWQVQFFRYLSCKAVIVHQLSSKLRSNLKEPCSSVRLGMNLGLILPSRMTLFFLSFPIIT